MIAIDWSTRHWFPRVLIALVAVICAEVFLDLVLSRTMENSLWFTGDIHQPDPKFAFRYTPNYSGWMRYKNDLFLEHLDLDERGDRLPATIKGSTREIVLIGGYSMTFSYGVPDSATIHKAISDHLSPPAMVRNTAWPGFDLYRNFHIYKDQVKGGKRADLAVVLFFKDNLRSFSSIPLAQEEFIETKPRGDLFKAFDRHAFAPREEPVKRAFSTFYYRSIICHKVADRASALASSLNKRLGAAPTARTSPMSPEVTERGRERLRLFTTHVCSYFGGMDNVLFVVLPGRQPQKNVDDLLTALPGNAHVLDLNRTGNDTIARRGTFALGHYNASSCAYIGERIAKAIEEMPGQLIPGMEVSTLPARGGFWPDRSRNGEGAAQHEHGPFACCTVPISSSPLAPRCDGHRR